MLILLAALATASAQSAPAATPAPAAAPATPAVAAKPAVPRFSRTAIGTCGCALYAPPGITFGPPTKSEDQADVWTGEVQVDGGYSMGAIVVKFPAPMDGTPEQLEELLVGYMTFLQGQLSITGAVGVGRGHTHTENPGARGVIDYWVDKDGDKWAVKGWVDKERLAVLFVYGPGEYPYFTAQQLFLDGFRFK